MIRYIWICFPSEMKKCIYIYNIIHTIIFSKDHPSFATQSRGQFLHFELPPCDPQRTPLRQRWAALAGAVVVRRGGFQRVAGDGGLGGVGCLGWGWMCTSEYAGRWVMKSTQILFRDYTVCRICIYYTIVCASRKLYRSIISGSSSSVWWWGFELHPRTAVDPAQIIN